MIEISCKCCGNATKVMTILDMIDKVDEYFKKDSLSKRFLDFVGLDYKDVTIKQNRTRLDLLNNHSINNSFGNYRIIKESLYPLAINFDECFTKVEKIDINTDFFLNSKIIDHLNLAIDTTDQYLENYLKQMLLIVDSKFDNVLEELSVVGKVIMLKLPNDRFNDEYAMNYYPDTNFPAISFDYYRDDLDEFNISNIKNLALELISYSGYYDDNTAPIRLWLQQEIVYMYPDYGGVCFWFDPNGSAGGIECFSDYLSKDDQLYKDFESWYDCFYENETVGFDWDDFNKEGRELRRKLQEIVLEDYIIVYATSYEENQYNKSLFSF